MDTTSISTVLRFPTAVATLGLAKTFGSNRGEGEGLKGLGHPVEAQWRAVFKRRETFSYRVFSFPSWFVVTTAAGFLSPWRSEVESSHHGARAFVLAAWNWARGWRSRECLLAKQTLQMLSKAHRFGKGKRISTHLKSSSACALCVPEELRIAPW